MATDGERLVVMLEARITDFEKNLAKANKTAARNFKQIETSAKTMSTRLESVNALGGKAFSGLSTAAIGVLAPLLSVGAAIGKAKSAMEEFGNISDAAAATGLDAEFFQVLAHQSELGGVAVDKMSSALETFSKNAGLAAEGKGKMVAALKELNPELLKNINAATSQEQRVRLAADAIDQAGSASQKAALSATLFGDAGTRLVEVFKGGSAAIDETAASARSLGIIVDRETISSMESLGDEFDTATKIMSLQFSKAVVDLAPLLIQGAAIAGDYAAAISRIVDSFRDLEAQSTQGLNTQLTDMSRQRLDIETEILELQGKQREEVSLMSGVAQSLGFADSKNPELLSGQIAELKKRDAEIAASEAKVLSILGGRKPTEAPAARPSATPANNNGPAARPARDKAAEQALREAKAVKELIADLDFERSLIGQSALAKEQMTAVRQAGAGATAEEKLQIEAKIAAIYSETAAVDANKAALEAVNEAGRDFAGTLVSGFLDGATAAETLGNALKNLVDRLVNSGLDALFDTKGGGLLSNLFGGGGFKANTTMGNFLSGVPGFATGTNSAPRGVALVGEKGPELVRFGGGEVVIPNNKLSAPTMPRLGQRQSGGSMPAMTFAPNIDARGASVEAVARLEQVVAKQQQEFSANVLTTMRKAKSTRNWR